MKHLLAYWSLRAASGLVGMLPWVLARKLGIGFGGLWGRLDRNRAEMASRHATRTSGNPRNGLDVMRWYGRYYVEALWARPRRIRDMLEATELTGRDVLISARDAGRGMIFALPHMGNWEAAAPIALRDNVSLVAVAENLPNRRITDWFTKMRADFGIEVVLATGRLEVMRKLEAAISEGRAVALLSDRDLKKKGVEVEFFGEATTMPPGPAALAVRTGAPLFPVGCYFTDDGYEVIIHPALSVPDGGTSTEKVADLTQQLARKFEEIIRREPSQWHLVVPNWPSDQQ